MRADVDAVHVLLMLGGEAGMKSRITFLGVKYANIRRQMHIQCDGKLIGRHAHRRVKMRYLRARMHAAVGTAGAVQDDSFLCHLLQRLFHGLLNGYAVGLCLPSDVIRSVVGDDHANTSHIRTR